MTDVRVSIDAPEGSYRHFPGGIEQLVAEATRYSGEQTAALITPDDPVQSVRQLAEAWRAMLVGSDFGAGCAVVPAALEPGVDAAGPVFERWTDLLELGLLRRRVAPDRARALATLIIGALEGAVVMARGQRSIRPLDDITLELERLVGQALK